MTSRTGVVIESRPTNLSDLNRLTAHIQANIQYTTSQYNKEGFASFVNPFSLPGMLKRFLYHYISAMHIPTITLERRSSVVVKHIRFT